MLSFFFYDIPTVLLYSLMWLFRLQHQQLHGSCILFTLLSNKETIRYWSREIENYRRENRSGTDINESFSYRKWISKYGNKYFVNFKATKREHPTHKTLFSLPSAQITLDSRKEFHCSRSIFHRDEVERLYRIKHRFCCQENCSTHSFLSEYKFVRFYLSTILPNIGRCCCISFGTSSIYLDNLEAIQRKICNIMGPYVHLL